MRFTKGDDFIELLFELETDSSLPSHADARVMTSLRASGFMGSATSHVDSHVLRRFSHDVRQLYTTLRGEAVLESMSPNELRVTISAVDDVGHLVVHATIGKLVYGDYSRQWHMVTGALDLEPSQLGSALAEEWLSNAG